MELREGEAHESLRATHKERKVAARQLDREFADKLLQVCSLANSAPEFVDA